MRGKRRGEAKKLSDEDAEERLNKLLVDSGERDRLRERLSKKLDADGWREEVKVGALQGTSKRPFPGCENMWWKNCVCLPAVGKQNATFSPDFTQPGFPVEGPSVTNKPKEY